MVLVVFKCVSVRVSEASSWLVGGVGGSCVLEEGTSVGST